MGNKFVRGSGGDNKFTKSTGLYPTCEWDDKTVKKLISKKKVAPRYPGREDPGPDLDECPICFLWYPGGLNRSKCCKQPICTECYLQFKKPNSQKQVTCPFCNSLNYSVKYTGSISKEERQLLEQEEQRVIEAKMLARKAELERQLVREKEVAAERAAELERRAREPPPPVPPPLDPPRSSRRPVSAALNSNRMSSSGQAMRPHSAGHPRRQPQMAYPDDEDERDERDGNMDIEELMVLEAIRLSLMEGQQQAESETGHEVEEGTYHDAGAAHRGLDDGESDSDDGDELSDDDGEGGTRNLSDDAEEDWPATSWGEDDLLTPASTAAGLHRSVFDEVLGRVLEDEEQTGEVETLLADSLAFFRLSVGAANASLAATRAHLSSPAASGRYNRMPIAVETTSSLSPPSSFPHSQPPPSPLSSKRRSFSSPPLERMPTSPMRSMPSSSFVLDGRDSQDDEVKIAQRQTAGQAAPNWAHAGGSEDRQSEDEDDELNDSFGPKILEDEGEGEGRDSAQWGNLDAGGSMHISAPNDHLVVHDRTASQPSKFAELRAKFEQCAQRSEKDREEQSPPFTFLANAQSRSGTARSEDAAAAFSSYAAATTRHDGGDTHDLSNLVIQDEVHALVPGQSRVDTDGAAHQQQAAMNSLEGSESAVQLSFEAPLAFKVNAEYSAPGDAVPGATELAAPEESRQAARERWTQMCPDGSVIEGSASAFQHETETARPWIDGTIENLEATGTVSTFFAREEPSTFQQAEYEDVQAQPATLTNAELADEDVTSETEIIEAEDEQDPRDGMNAEPVPPIIKISDSEVQGSHAVGQRTLATLASVRDSSSSVTTLDEALT